MSVIYVDSCDLPTPWGVFNLHGFEDTETGKEHLALVFGDVEAQSSVLCRVHSECLTGDSLFSMRCDCGAQLQGALERVAKEGAGVILYLRQEGRGESEPVASNDTASGRTQNRRVDVVIKPVIEGRENEAATPPPYLGR